MVFTEETGTHGHVWVHGYEAGMKQTEDEERLVEARDSHQGSGERDKRVMMTSSCSARS